MIGCWAPSAFAYPPGETGRLQFCNDLKFAYNEAITYYNGDKKRRGKWKDKADNIKILAEANRCSWAQ